MNLIKNLTLRDIKNLAVCSTFLYALLITFLSLYNFSDDIELPEVVGFDKFVHFCFYFGLNTLLLCTRRVYSPRVTALWTIALTIVAVLFSCLVELIQPSTGRACDIYDVVANSSGAIFAVIIFYSFSQRWLVQIFKGQLLE